MMSCAPKSLREAEEVVAQADSLRAAGQMYGIDAGDSATLAQAYETLGSLSLFNFHFSPSYAHACYHYGRLLREKDNPVEAMQCFINATHTRTHDYHILGRVYSNMGDIAHLAGEFPLAYDMFRYAAKSFLQSRDTLTYYYAINSSALELAEQSKIEETLVSLNTIDTSDARLSSFVNFSKAILYRNIERYDSAILFADAALKELNEESGVMLVKAQAFYGLDMKDSALTYAKRVLSNQSATYQNTFNALYIISNIDSTLKKEEIRVLSTKREDIRYYEYEPDKDKSTIAVQLLEQDLARKPNLAWLYAICATLAIVGLVVFIYVYRKRRQHTLLAQQIEDLTIQNKEAAVQHEKIINDVEKHKRNIIAEIEQNCHLITRAESFPKNIHWKSYNKMCAVIDKRFYLLASKLRTKYKLNETETRLCMLTLLDCKYELIADLLYRSNSSIGTLKIRVAKKIGTTAKNLRMYLIENECVN